MTAPSPEVAFWLIAVPLVVGLTWLNVWNHDRRRKLTPEQRRADDEREQYYP